MSHTAELLVREVVSVSPSDSIEEVSRLMKRRHLGCVVVVDGGKVTGVFTERDILTRIACQVDNLQAAKVKDFMTANPTMIEGDDPIAHALHLMAIYGFRYLPVVDSANKSAVMISFRDVVRYIEKYFA